MKKILIFKFSISVIFFLTVMLFSTAQANAQVPNLSTEYGCYYGYDATTVLCYDCWSCSSQPGGKGCFGNCISGCPKCFRIDEGGSGWDDLYIYLDGVPIEHIVINEDWNVENDWNIGGTPAVKLNFTEYVPD